jgi:competence ComEA-like helix-hairpin-helix protein
MLAGAGIRLYQITFQSAPQFDYRLSDSTFAALSNFDEESIADSTNQKGEEIKRKLNINTATKQQLIDLPGIGDVMAERIIKFRMENGMFTSPKDLRAIKGMSKKKLEQLEPLITTQ